MKKFTFLFALLCTMCIGAMAQTALVSSDELNAKTEEAKIFLRNVSGTNGLWFNGVSSDEVIGPQNMFVWVPAGEGKFYLKKAYPTSEQGDGYIQKATAGGATAFGAAATAEPFVTVQPVLGGTGNRAVSEASEEWPAHAVMDNLVRFVSQTTNQYLNVQGTAGPAGYRGGTGGWSFNNIYDATKFYKLDVTVEIDDATSVESLLVEAGTAYTPAAREGYICSIESYTMPAEDTAITVRYISLSEIDVTFNRTGTDAASVTVAVVNQDGAAIEGASATLLSCSQAFKPTAGNITSAILCPNVNGNTSPTIEMVFSLSGVPAGFSFDNIGLDIHALNGGSTYQQNSDSKDRKWSVTVEQGAVADALAPFGTLSDIDIAAGIGESGVSVHKVWDVIGEKVTVGEGTVIIKMTITADAATNLGCFFGLSQIKFSTSGAIEPEPEPEPEPEAGEGKVYYISWKNTGANYITEGSDHYMTVENNDVTKAQFWRFIPTENENCYHIQNTATNRYIGSCNLTPSSSSRITTTTTPVEYYVMKTAATTGENANCYYFSSTDCGNYNKESSGPRALNKDGASSYVITWTAGVGNVGSYWTLIETPDLYEIRPFTAGSTIGNIKATYNVESLSGKYLTLTEGGASLSALEMFNDAQEWYFVGANNASGWQIASASKPATVIGLQGDAVVSGEGLTTKWKVNESNRTGYFYFTDMEGGKALVIDGDSLFRFSELRSAYARNNQIYNNPCGNVGSTFVKNVALSGEGLLKNLYYSATSKPSTWHVLYTNSDAEVAKGSSFDVNVTLSAANDLNVNAYFDWNADAVFETTVPFTVNGTECTATVTVPEWAVEKVTRMRIRVNGDDLNLAEDEIYGFIYDFEISAAPAQEGRTVTLGVNERRRGSVSLSEVAESYAVGTELTVTATPKGDSQFVCWKEGTTIVSTDAEYTFALNTNRNLVAYFSPNTQEDVEEGVTNVATDEEITVMQQGEVLVAVCGSEVLSMTLFTANAAVAAQTAGDTLNVASLPLGIYIVRVQTALGYKNLKIQIK